MVTKQKLLDASWPETFVTEASLLEVIRLLRDALGDDRTKPTYIQTVHRRGYRFLQATSRPPSPLATSVPAQQPPSPLATSAPWWQRAEWRPLLASASAAVVGTVGMAIVFALFGQRPADAPPTMRFTIPLPQDTAIDPLRGSVAVSLDGTRMVFVAMQDGQPRLFLRTIDRDAPSAIDGSEGAADPFFSPDGEWLGFFAHGSLKKLRVEGGTPVKLCAARAGAGASWGRDGTIVFGGGPGGGLARVSEDGGEPVVLAVPPRGSRDVSYGWPDVLPDNSGVIYTATSVAESNVAVLDFASGGRQQIVEGAAFGRYAPTGHLVFERRGRLEAAPFSLAARVITAAPRPILRGLATADAALAGPRFAFSRTGSLLYVPGSSTDADERLQWLDVRGGLEPVPIAPVPAAAVDVAPDLRQLAFTVERGDGQDLWVGDLEHGALSRLTTDGRSISPTWRPDGLEIAFAYSKAGPFNLFVRPAGRDGLPQPLFESPWNQFPTSWSPDGKLIAFTEFHPLTGADIWLVDLRSRERRQLVRTLFDETHARFSPDGHWLAYMSNESGRWEVFVRPVDASSPRLQVSTNGGAWPCWSVDGRTLYFSMGGRAAAVAVVASESSPPGTRALQVSAPLVISGREDLQLAGGHADLNRVLVRRDGAAPARHVLRVVIGWFAELRRLG